MTIGIDARLWGIKHAGIGRYVENLVRGLLKQDEENKYVLFVPPVMEGAKLNLAPQVHEVGELSQTRLSQKHDLSQADEVEESSTTEFLLGNPRITLVPTDIRHYTVAEQWQFYRLLQKYPVDLIHFPHFNVPLLYRKPYVVTIHDILWHQVRGKNVTTLSGPIYYAKYMGYRLAVWNAVRAAVKVIVPSQWVKKQLLEHYKGLAADKVEVVYEGVDHYKSSEFRVQSSEIVLNHDRRPSILSEFCNLNSKFFLYVGSCYPHKNVETLIRAMAELKRQGRQEKLIIVSSRNIFRDRLEQLVSELDVRELVVFAGRLSDQELAELYPKAIALVHPSLSEGFGLTGLEAMKHGCLVIASDKGSLPEIYYKAAIYIDDPKNAKLLAQVMMAVQGKEGMWDELRKKGRERAKAFTWSSTASHTFSVYNKVLGS